MQLLPMASSPYGLISARDAVITKTPGWEVLTTTSNVNVTQGHGGGGGGVNPPPPAVYGHSNTSLLIPLVPSAEHKAQPGPNTATKRLSEGVDVLGPPGPQTTTGARPRAFQDPPAHARAHPSSSYPIYQN